DCRRPRDRLAGGVGHLALLLGRDATLERRVQRPARPAVAAPRDLLHLAAPLEPDPPARAAPGRGRRATRAGHTGHGGPTAPGAPGGLLPRLGRADRLLAEMVPLHPGAGGPPRPGGGRRRGGGVVAPLGPARRGPDVPGPVRGGAALPA